MFIKRAGAVRIVKMAEDGSTGENGHAKMNGFHSVPKPFLIGVCGGTASGKVTELNEPVICYFCKSCYWYFPSEVQRETENTWPLDHE